MCKVLIKIINKFITLCNYNVPPTLKYNFCDICNKWFSSKIFFFSSLTPSDPKATFCILLCSRKNMVKEKEEKNLKKKHDKNTNFNTEILEMMLTATMSLSINIFFLIHFFLFLCFVQNKSNLGLAIWQFCTNWCYDNNNGGIMQKAT